MKILRRIFDSVLIIEPKIYPDNRGTFYEWYNRRVFDQLGVADTFVQDNHSLSRSSGTIRGMHYQMHPKAQSKLVRVTRGAIYNVIVDIRVGSPTCLQWEAVELNELEPRLIYIPVGFANGFCSLADNTEVIYKVDQYYSPDHDRSFAYNDPDIGILWPVTEPIQSDRDKQAPLFKNTENNFTYTAAL